MRKIYKYYTGETVWTLDGEAWFITDDEKGTVEPIKQPVLSKIALDLTGI